MKRIFVAADISEEARRKTAQYIDGLKSKFRNLRVGWEKPEKLHLTLKFLGDVSERQLDEIRGSIRETIEKFAKLGYSAADFNFQISGTGVFPNAKRPRVLWLGLKDESDGLNRLNEILEIECERIGFEKENRKFSPHLTIGRIREPFNSFQLAQTHLQNDFEPVEFEVSEIVIYESKLQPTGSLYSKLKSFSLFV